MVAQVVGGLGRGFPGGNGPEDPFSERHANVPEKGSGSTVSYPDVRFARVVVVQAQVGNVAADQRAGSSDDGLQHGFNIPDACKVRGSVVEDAEQAFPSAGLPQPSRKGAGCSGCRQIDQALRLHGCQLRFQIFSRNTVDQERQKPPQGGPVDGSGTYTDGRTFLCTHRAHGSWLPARSGSRGSVIGAVVAGRPERLPRTDGFPSRSSR